MPAPTATERDYVASLARGLAVIEAFGPEHRALSLSDVAGRVGISRAAARRFVLTLERLGYVEREGRLFRLTPRVLGLGYAYLSSSSLWQVAEPILKGLVREVGESCSVSVRSDADIVVVANASAPRLMTITPPVGTRLPAHATAAGRVLLAALPAEEREDWLARLKLNGFTPRTVTSEDILRQRLDEVIRDGFALTDQELEEGLRSIAVTIRDRRDRPIAALSCSSHAARMSLADLRVGCLAELRRAARAITETLPADPR